MNNNDDIYLFLAVLDLRGEGWPLMSGVSFVSKGVAMEEEKQVVERCGAVVLSFVGVVVLTCAGAMGLPCVRRVVVAGVTAVVGTLRAVGGTKSVELAG